MADQCKHLKPCQAMAKFRKKYGEDAGDVGWENCGACPLRPGQSDGTTTSPTKKPGFLEKTIVKG